MNNFGKKWSEEEENFLKENYSEEGINYCVSNLEGRTKRSVIQHAKKLKLKLSERGRSISLKKYKEKDIVNAVKNSYCYSDVCRYFELTPQSGNYTNIKKLIRFYNVDISHFLTYSELNKLRCNSIKNKKKNLDDYLTKNSTLDRKQLKYRLYDEGLKERKCELCGQTEEWKGKYMSLILDHVNGINNDNRIENLRIVCPNCNATLDTFCGKKNKKLLSSNINNTLNNNKTSSFITNSKIPEKNILIDDFIRLKSFVNVGKKYCVSDNAVRKWCKKYNILNDIKKPANIPSP